MGGFGGIVAAGLMGAAAGVGDAGYADMLEKQKQEALALRDQTLAQLQVDKAGPMEAARLSAIANDPRTIAQDKLANDLKNQNQQRLDLQQQNQDDNRKAMLTIAQQKAATQQQRADTYDDKVNTPGSKTYKPPTDVWQKVKNPDTGFDELQSKLVPNVAKVFDQGTPDTPAEEPGVLAKIGHAIAPSLVDAESKPAVKGKAGSYHLIDTETREPITIDEYQKRLRDNTGQGGGGGGGSSASAVDSTGAPDVRPATSTGAGMPTGVPAGSKVIGTTPDGAHQIWESPDGKRWKV